MMLATTEMLPARSAISPLILCDRLLTLAKDADSVGMRGAAEHLLNLVSEVLDGAPAPRRIRR